jgi:hypothetical protein
MCYLSISPLMHVIILMHALINEKLWTFFGLNPPRISNPATDKLYSLWSFLIDSSLVQFYTKFDPTKKDSEWVPPSYPKVILGVVLGSPCTSSIMTLQEHLHGQFILGFLANIRDITGRRASTYVAAVLALSDKAGREHTRNKACIVCYTGKCIC